MVFDAVGKILPRNAVWVASNLKRTHQTASAIWAAGFPKPDAMPHEADFAEQHLGDWQGMNRAAFFASRPINVGSYWFAPIDEPSPNGESFMDLYNRVRRGIERISVEHAGKDILRSRMAARSRRPSVLRSTISRIAVFAFTIDNCSVTRLDHLASDGHSGWRIPMVNQQPWIADPSHAAMHQPAGPKVTPTKTGLVITVIARSLLATKQSSSFRQQEGLDCFVASLLAMTEENSNRKN